MYSDVLNSYGKLIVLLKILDQIWTQIWGTNTLAYFAAAVSDDEKKFYGIDTCSS